MSNLLGMRAPEVLRVRPSAVAALAADKAWRSKLYAGLLIGFGVLPVAFAVMVTVFDAGNEHGKDLQDLLAGAAVFVLAGLGMMGFGITRIQYARQLGRVAHRAQLHPDVPWIVIGPEVRSTDPTGTAGPPMTLKLSATAREQLLRERVE